MRPHTRQPTRLPRPWDSPGKNTGVGCHFLLQCMKVKSEREVVQSCLTLHDPMGCSLPGSSIEESKRQVHSNIKLFSFQFWEIVNSCYNWPFSCSHSLPVLHTVLTNASLRKYYGKLYANKLDKLGKMNKLLEILSVPRLNHEEKETLNRHKTSYWICNQKLLNKEKYIRWLHWLIKN